MIRRPQFGPDLQDRACWGPRWLTDILPVLIWMPPPVLAVLNGAGRVAVFGRIESLRVGATGQGGSAGHHGVRIARESLLQPARDGVAQTG